MKQTRRLYLHQISIGGVALSWMAQLALLLLTVGALVYLAVPMMELSATNGLNSRYHGDLTGETLVAWQRISDMARMQQVMVQLAYILVAWAILGWASLQVMAHWPDSKPALLMAAALGGLAAAVTQAFGIAASVWTSAACVLFLFSGLL
ncbi:MAG: hypothetical protein RLZZ401_1621, partial [Pseudomonadota bacterium]